MSDEVSDEDRDLHDAFAAVRREEATQVPPFSMPSRIALEHRRRRWSGTLVAATACAAALIVAAVSLRPKGRTTHEGASPEPAQAIASITTWKPETDFLLNTPGRELLQGVPVIGESHPRAHTPGRG